MIQRDTRKDSEQHIHQVDDLSQCRRWKTEGGSFSANAQTGTVSLKRQHREPGSNRQGTSSQPAHRRDPETTGFDKACPFSGHLHGKEPETQDAGSGTDRPMFD